MPHEPCSQRNLKRVRTIDETQKRLIDRGVLRAAGRLTTRGFTDTVAGQPGRPERGEDDRRDDKNFNENGCRGHNDRKPDYKVELLTRTYVGDVGLRPIPGSIIFWESPDIWIEGPAGDPDKAVPGVPNTVKVHVWNTGLADCWGAQVELYWCDPSVGVSPLVATPIGVPFVLPVMAGGDEVISFTWIPDLVNEGHECLVAQVFDPLSDNIVAPFNPVQDRHVSQRNVSVVEAAVGQKIIFPFFANNLSLISTFTSLEVQRLEGQALDTVAMSMGRAPWTAAPTMELNLTRPKLVGAFDPKIAADRNVFREALQDTPTGAEAKRVMTSLQERTFVQRDNAPQRMYERQEDDGLLEQADGNGNTVVLPAVRNVTLSLEGTVVPTTAPGTAGVYRIVERSDDRITGGLTIVVETLAGVRNGDIERDDRQPKT